jgi:hypothetical protein
VLIFKTYRPAAATTTTPATTNNQTIAPNYFESLVRGEEGYFLNFYDSVITLHMMALNEFTWVVDEFKSTEYPNLARALFCVYMILVSILLVNLLIAMLGKTYQDIASQPNENLRQWARALLTVERMCSYGTRLRMLNRYSTEKPQWTTTTTTIQAAGTKSVALCRCYSSTWALSERDTDEINAIKQLNKEHQVSSARLARLKGRLSVSPAT